MVANPYMLANTSAARNERAERSSLNGWARAKGSTNKRVAAMDTFVAYQPLLEDEILPQADDFYKAMQEVADY